MIFCLKMMYKKQYGFRSNHSTYKAVIELVNDVSKAIDDDMNTVGIFMDLSKAFDTIDHSILLEKIYHYSFREVLHDWFNSYLTNRKQFIIQESLGMRIFDVVCLKDPYLDLCFLNDICYTSGLLKTILFADDTTCFYSHKDVQTLCNIVSELKEVYNWFKANMWSLNAKKNKFNVSGNTFSNKQ